MYLCIRFKRLYNTLRLTPGPWFFYSITYPNQMCPLWMVLPVSTLPGRERLRSAATQNYDIRRVKLKFGERAFAVAAPKAWNSLPDSLKQTNDTVKFGKDLKTYLFNFNLAYN